MAKAHHSQEDTRREEFFFFRAPQQPLFRLMFIIVREVATTLSWATTSRFE